MGVGVRGDGGRGGSGYGEREVEGVGRESQGGRGGQGGRDGEFGG